MARDEALLATRRLPTLRFYRWQEATVSLGYFQAFADLHGSQGRTANLPCVRRPTGGKAILHEHELTYSLCAPEKGALGGGPCKSMRNLHESFAEELSRQAGKKIDLRDQASLESDISGSFWCFADSATLDLHIQRRKLLGSAARRRQGWILYHGSLMLRPPEETPNIGSLGFEPDLDRLRHQLCISLEIQFEPGSWHEEELELAQQLTTDKFSQDHFTRRR